MPHSITTLTRRSMLQQAALFTLSLASAAAPRRALANEPGNDVFSSAQDGATRLRELGERLAAIERRRDFDEVPFMLTSAQYWDKDAAAQVLSYRYRARQVWENTDIAGPWPGLMREAMNGQVFAHDNPDFLAVSATHGLAHLALFSQPMWDKYALATLAGPKFAMNSLIAEKPGVSPDDKLEDVQGFYGPMNSNIVSLQRRGAVFIGCHDSIHAIARTLQTGAFETARADHIAADLTNNMIPDVVLVPSVVAFMVEMQRRGFTYSKGG